ncbi:MAG: cyclic nucleotide-binding domain-containing protein [Candidatus Gracilibacteria bacterium]|nr:cyclic nucleotide-binding domain-containing protein [Candidatus Gracilibacteria bacterium]
MSFLDSVDMLSSLSQQEKENLALFCQEKYLSAGDQLFLEGDEANAMYFLAEGKIEIYKERAGEEIILGEIKAEEILGEMAVFGGEGVRMASARAIKDTKLITMLSFSIKEIAFKHPDLMIKIENIIKSREEKNQKIKGIDY